MDVDAFKVQLWPDNWREMSNVDKKLHLEEQIERVLDAFEDGSHQPGEVGLDAVRIAISHVAAGLYWAAPHELFDAVRPDYSKQPWPNLNSRPPDIDQLTPENLRRFLEWAKAQPVRDQPVFMWPK